MSDSNTPNGGIQHTGVGRYTGHTLANAVVNANISKGAVVQFAAGMSAGAKATSESGALVAGEWAPQEDLGCGVGQPTAGYTAPFAVVGEGLFDHDLAKLNELEGVTANLRKGGRVPLVKSGVCRALVKAACTAGVTLLCPVDGQFYMAPYLASGLFSQSLGAGTALSNTVSTEQNFAGAGSSVTIPANSLKAGDVIRGQVQGIRTAVATDTLTVKVKIGTNIVAVTGAVVGAVNDIFVINYTIVIRTIGSSGTAVAYSTSFNGTSGQAAAAGEIPTGSAVASFAIDTTAAVTIQVTGTYNGTTATNTANLEAHNTYIDRLDTSMGSKPLAVALETIDNSAAAALTKVLLLPPAY